MNELTNVFQYGTSDIRTILKGEEVWFVATDICGVLDIKNATQALQKLDDDERSMFNIGRQGKVNIVNESGLYELIFSSRKEEAKHFKKWVKQDVLPSIRKTGGYRVNIPQSFSEALRLAADLQDEIERNKPKIEAHDRFISGENLQTMTQVAKALGFGRNKLFAILREQKVLMQNNTPYQSYIDRGYFQVKETPKQLGDKNLNFTQTYVTAKGVDYLNKILNQKGA